MNLNNRLMELKEIPVLAPQEECIRLAIDACKETYFRKEQDHLLTYWEFLWGQLQYTRKRWWALQAGLLILAFQAIPNMDDYQYKMRSVGVIGCLFVVLMIPELWRNRETDSTQIEASCLYSLQQVYAARITLFGIADVALLTIFCFTLGHMGFSLIEVLSQFLLPVTVTACICFSLLCGKSNVSETISLVACLIFGGAWWLILMNDGIYTRIVPSVWAALFAMALMFLTLTVRKTIRTTNQQWEVILT